MQIYKAAASGIVGNLFTESNLNPTAPGDHGTSFGLAQWHNARWNNLIDYAKSNNMNHKTMDTQLNFLWHELNTSEKKALYAIQNSQSAKEAARNFAYKFERMKAYNIQRENNAEKIFNS